MSVRDFPQCLNRGDHSLLLRDLVIYTAETDNQEQKLCCNNAENALTRC